MHILEQPMANNECKFYVMWAMHKSLSNNAMEENRMVHMLPISCMSINSTKDTTVLANTFAFGYHLAWKTAP